ncbi:TonB family protein [Shinella sp. BYT-45]|uniref:TonB family protein n=1 Tax=Shinella sp. BYT-45 TaxID=3377377 RepID=UPI00397F552D
MKPYLHIAVALAFLHSTPAFSQDAKAPRVIPTDKQSWSKAVGARIQRRSTVVVSRARLEGIYGDFNLKIGFQISPDGNVSNVRVVESSGDPAVDKIAMDMPALASPFPAFTPDMQATPVSLVAPIVLHLEVPTPVEGESGAAGETGGSGGSQGGTR